MLPKFHVEYLMEAQTRQGARISKFKISKLETHSDQALYFDLNLHLYLTDTI